MRGRVADWVRRVTQSVSQSVSSRSPRAHSGRVTRAAVCGSSSMSSSRDLAAYAVQSARWLLCGTESDTPGGAGTENCVTYLRLVFYLYTLNTASWRSAAGSPPVSRPVRAHADHTRAGTCSLTHGETSSHAEWDREGVSSPPPSRQGSRSPPSPPPPIACDTAHHSPSPPSRRGRRRCRRRSHYHATTLRRPAPPIPKTAI
jgi:hypothetical protein